MQADHNQDDFLHQIHPPNHSIMSTSSSIGGRRRSIESPPKPNPRFLLVLLKGIIMALIITLFFLLLGIAAVALLHFIIAGGALHIRRLLRSSSSSSSSSPSSIRFLSDSVTAAAYSAEELHRSLTSIEYSEIETDEKECAICLERFKIGSLIRRLPDCKHTYHSNCVGRWLMRVANCPICRRRVVLNRVSLDVSGFDDDDDEIDRIFWE